MNTNSALLEKKVAFKNKLNAFVNSAQSELIDLLSASNLTGPFILKNGTRSKKLNGLLDQFLAKYHEMPEVHFIHFELSRYSLYLTISVNAFKFSGGDSDIEKANKLTTKESVWICDHDNETFTRFSEENHLKTDYDAKTVALARKRLDDAAKTLRECEAIVCHFGQTDWVRQ